MNIMDHYKKLATTAFTKFYSAKQTDTESSQHAISLAQSLLLTRDKKLSGGGFINAIMNNNLDEAIGRADTDALNHLSFFVYCKKYVHL